MKILRHKLYHDDGTAFDFIRSPHQGSVIVPEYLVMHYTAGGSAAGTIAWFQDPNAQASAHLVIAADGAVTQMVAFNRRAWHAGPSRWDGREGVNDFSIGIELDNPGRLERGAAGWITEWGVPVDDDKVILAEHKNGGGQCGWHVFTEAQLESAAVVGALLARHYDLRDVIGHDDVAPWRKQDPGPAFPMNNYRARVMGRKDDKPVAYRTVSWLNIRYGPGIEYEKLEAGPLPPGTRLEVMADSGVWRLAVIGELDGEYDIQGWVHGNYLTREDG